MTNSKSKIIIVERWLEKLTKKGDNYEMIPSLKYVLNQYKNGNALKHARLLKPEDIEHAQKVHQFLMDMDEPRANFLFKVYYG